MTADPFPLDHHLDPSSGTAAIPAVTDTMMDHAAHRAAELADGVAHRTVLREPAPPVAAEDGGHAAAASDAPGEESAAPISDAAVRPSTEIVAASIDAVRANMADAVEVLQPPGEPVPAPEAARPAPADAFGRFTATLFGMMRTNVAATSAHVSALMRTKSVPEAVALNADHLGRQLDAMTAQARELTTLAQTLTFETLQPLKGVIAPDR